MRTLVIALLALGVAAGATAGPAPDKDALWAAAENGDLATVTAHLASGGSVNADDDEKLTLLNWAAYGGSLDVVKLLVAKGADVNAHTNEKAWTPLMNAANQGFALVVGYLLDHGADLNALSADGLSALSFAAMKQRPDVVRLLLQRGADGGNALRAMESKKDAAAIRLLVESGVSVDATPRQKLMWFHPGETALFHAAYDNQLELVTLLLNLGANPNLSSPEGGNMSAPLLLAAYHCNRAMIDALLAHGASRASAARCGASTARWSSGSASPTT